MKRLQLVVLVFLGATCLIWGAFVVKLTSSLRSTSTTTVPKRQIPELILRSFSKSDNNNDKKEEVFPKRKRIHFTPVVDPLPSENGFENPNKLPPLISVGPPSFFYILAPPYYGKSPMDGTRSYAVSSPQRLRLCNSIASPAHGKFPLSMKMCSYGPELVYPLSSKVHVAHLLHDVCLTFNIDSKKQVQRGLVYFDPQNEHSMRCVPCPNPIEFREWGQHACGVMWNHQINARSLQDYVDCYGENAKFIQKIGQRQIAPAELESGYMHSDYPILELSFAHSNPGHQCFDSLFSILPIIFDSTEHEEFQVIVHQSPTCPDKEWLCGLLRRIGFFDKHKLVDFNAKQVPCFANLVIPKWGMARDTLMPAHWLEKLQNTLHEKFDFSTMKPQDTILLYAHETLSVEVGKHRRTWQNMRQLDGVIPNVHIVNDFAAMTIAEQGAAFYHAKIVVMPHGGQFGNSVFARRGTIMVELACTVYSHLGMTAMQGELVGSWPKALGFIHLVVVPCDCDDHRLDSNFRFGPQSLLQLLQLAKEYEPGTHVIQGENGERCFGSNE